MLFLFCKQIWWNKEGGNPPVSKKMPISIHKYTRKSFVDIGGRKPTLADENNDDQKDKWVDERREGKGRVWLKRMTCKCCNFPVQSVGRVSSQDKLVQMAAACQANHLDGGT